MKIIISGASGLIGKPLIASLRNHSHEVVQLVRRAPQANQKQWNPNAGQLDIAVLEGADAVIHLSGAGIGDRRWTAKYKQELLDSRTKSTTLLATTIAKCSKKPRVFLSASGVGIYGSRDDEQLTEQSSHGASFLAEICKQWEAAAKPAVDAGVRSVFLRTGIVLTPLGGALKKQLPLFKFGLGGKFGNGKQWQSWISLDDEISAIEYLLTANISGAVNLTAPNPVTNAEFTKALARTLRRPALLPIPKFGPKLLLGSELAENLLFTGQRVMPAELQKSGFAFQHSTIDLALRALLNK